MSAHCECYRGVEPWCPIHGDPEYVRSLERAAEDRGRWATLAEREPDLPNTDWM